MTSDAPGTLFEIFHEIASDASHFTEVVTKHLHNEIAVGAGDLIVHAVNHRLRKADRYSWHARVSFA